MVKPFLPASVFGRLAPARGAACRLARRAGRGASLARRALFSRELAPAFAGAVLFALAFLLVDPLAAYRPSYSSALYSRDGELLGARSSSDGQWRFEADVFAGLPERYRDALVEYEDRRFYGHTGFDTLAIARALRDNRSAGRVVSGGSTISMQVARLSRPAARRDLGTKLVELWAALRLELFNDKESILGLYAERAPYGANVVGLEAAGFRWFGRRPVDLTWAEAASLAVLPNSPGLVHPGRSRDELERKRDALLESLHERGAMDEWSYRSALAERLPMEPRPMPALSPHLAARAAPGRTVTTLDRALQERANALLERHVARMSPLGIRNAAALVLRVEDSSVLAYVGNARSAGIEGSMDVDCAQAARSSGSILKPFLYAAMLDSGELTPSRLVADIPTRVGSYSPENNLKTYSGAVRADEALARSLNVPFVRLLRSYGVERFASVLKRMGFSTLKRAPADYGLTLVLGGAETTLADAAGAYAALARAALGPSPGSARDANRDAQFTGILWRQDDLERPRALSQKPFSPGAAWLTLEALTAVGRPDDEASWQEYASSLRVAWKTGTSFGSRDAWAIGVTRDYVVAVWVGNASGEGRPALKGTDSAAPLLFDLFAQLPRSRWFPAPEDDLVSVTVCADSGYAAGPDCASVRTQRVPRGATVDAACPYCRVVHLSADGRYQLSAEAAGSEGLRSEKRFVLPPAMEWYYKRAVIGYRPLPPWLPGAKSSRGGDIEFIAPEQGALLYLPVELDGSLGMTVFRAAHRDPQARLFWHLDGDYLGETRGDHRVEARPAAGEHELLVMDQDGESASRRFTALARDE